ncbi:MAG TPA: L,D-transpeptidase [Kofleriaceae bacterium]
MKTLKYAALLVALAACASDDAKDPAPQPDGMDDSDPGDMSPGDVEDNFKTDDGGWGSALQCKPIPNLVPLVKPKITLSIDGLSLHLTDANGFDKVYPVGAGKIDPEETSSTYRESFSYYPLQGRPTGDFEITPSSIQPCKTWWTDSETGEKSPVFAGLPFMSWDGAYAVHGPIDNYRAPNGGNLRRGYVSHGCFRMEAADVVEVYAYIKGIAHVPVHVQRAVEKRVDGTRVDLAQKWVGSQCSADADCNFTGGFCHANPLTQKGFCSARCTSGCADKAGRPTTFCVADPDAAGKGMCVNKSQPENFECRPYDHFQPAAVTRFNNPAVSATACLPKSPGWVGDHCFADADCGNGTQCRGAKAPVLASASTPAKAAVAGVCSMACTKLCADEPGYNDTFCAAEPLLGTGGSCVRQCTPGTNASECPTDMTCSMRARPSLIGSTTAATPSSKYVCVPKTAN